MSAEDHLEEIAQKFWQSWSTWRRNQGWTLGLDRPDAKMSPFLVHSWDGLDVEAKGWFRQHAALVLYAAQPYTGSTPSPPVVPPVAASAPQSDETTQKAIAKLEAGLKALSELKTDIGERKVRTALKLLKGEPIRKRPTRR